MAIVLSPLSYRAEGALSIESPENIVENTFVLKKRKDKKVKQHLTADLINQKKWPAYFLNDILN